ncbi:unnamed protein product [Chrysoparadoxa australica]
MSESIALDRCRQQVRDLSQQLAVLHAEKENISAMMSQQIMYLEHDNQQLRNESMQLHVECERERGRAADWEASCAAAEGNPHLVNLVSALAEASEIFLDHLFASSTVQAVRDLALGHCEALRHILQPEMSAVYSSAQPYAVHDLSPEFEANVVMLLNERGGQETCSKLAADYFSRFGQQINVLALFDALKRSAMHQVMLVPPETIRVVAHGHEAVQNIQNQVYADDMSKGAYMMKQQPMPVQQIPAPRVTVPLKADADSWNGPRNTLSDNMMAPSSGSMRPTTNSGPPATATAGAEAATAEDRPSTPSTKSQEEAASTPKGSHTSKPKESGGSASQSNLERVKGDAAATSDGKSQHKQRQKQKQGHGKESEAGGTSSRRKDGVSSTHHKGASPTHRKGASPTGSKLRGGEGTRATKGKASNGKEPTGWGPAPEAEQAIAWDDERPQRTQGRKVGSSTKQARDRPQGQTTSGSIGRGRGAVEREGDGRDRESGGSSSRRRGGSGADSAAHGDAAAAAGPTQQQPNWQRIQHELHEVIRESGGTLKTSDMLSAYSKRWNKVIWLGGMKIAKVIEAGHIAGIIHDPSSSTLHLSGGSVTQPAAAGGGGGVADHGDSQEGETSTRTATVQEGQLVEGRAHRGKTRHDLARRRYCRFFLQGVCRYGNKCRDLHEQSPSGAGSSQGHSNHGSAQSTPTATTPTAAATASTSSTPAKIRTQHQSKSAQKGGWGVGGTECAAGGSWGDAGATTAAAAAGSDGWETGQQGEPAPQQPQQDASGQESGKVSSPRPCVYYNRGKCKFGASCQNVHGPRKGRSRSGAEGAP